MTARPWIGGALALALGAMMLGGACATTISSDTDRTSANGGNGGSIDHPDPSSPGFGGTGPGSTSSANGGTSASSGGSANCGDLRLSPAKCQRCSKANCCAEASACRNGTDCGNLLVCDSEMDAATCEIMFSAGVANERELLSCLGTNCGDVCDVNVCPDDQLETGDQSDANDKACTTCVQEKCCDAGTAATAAYNDQNCDTDSNCAFLTATNACGSDGLGSVACAGDPAAQALEKCMHDSCGDGQGNHLCASPICNADIELSGASACADCLGARCCAQYGALGCENGSDCSATMTALQSCVTSDGNCPDGVAKDAYECRTTSCSAACQ